MSRRTQRGFTLIELMTVVAIVGILTAVLASFSGGGAGTPRTTADRISGMMQFARLRAEAQRTMHRVRFQSNVISIWEATTTGFMQTPAFVADFTQAMDLPNNVIVYAASTSIDTTIGGAVTANANLPFDVDIYPDGSSTGGTVYLTDTDGSGDKFRILVYKVTGSAIIREDW